MTKTNTAVLATAFIGFAMIACGGTVQHNGAINSWTEWDSVPWLDETFAYRSPTPSDLVQIHAQRHAYLTTGGKAIGALNMYAYGGADLRIDSGGSLTVTTAGGQNGIITLSGAGSVVNEGLFGTPDPIPNVGNISVEAGGSLTSENTGARTVLEGNAAQPGSLNLNGGTFTAQGSAFEAVWLNRAEINLSSGVFDMTGTHVLSAGGLDINIYGDQTTIDFGLLNFSINAPAVNFKMDSDGISTVNMQGWYHLAEANIVVDGSEYVYAGGTEEFVLFSGSSLETLPASVTADNFGGLDVSFSQDGGDYVMTIIPEPATTGLIGFTVLAGFFARRRLIK